MLKIRFKQITYDMIFTFGMARFVLDLSMVRSLALFATQLFNSTKNKDRSLDYGVLQYINCNHLCSNCSFFLTSSRINCSIPQLIYFRFS